ncbi:uncharacterized protein LOC121878987 [Homarus americanus]|nr:uncharacterized protein LOC121878987 [Homarus americanus]
MKVLVAALALVATLAVTGNAEPLPEADPGFHRGFGSFGGRSHGGFGGYGGYGPYRGKRSADAEALADPEADPSAGHLSYGGYGGYGGFQGISRQHHYGKRSADADPEPDFSRYGGFRGHSGGFGGFSGYGRYGRSDIQLMEFLKIALSSVSSISSEATKATTLPSKAAITTKVRFGVCVSASFAMVVVVLANSLEATINTVATIPFMTSTGISLRVSQSFGFGLRICLGVSLATVGTMTTITTISSMGSAAEASKSSMGSATEASKSTMVTRVSFWEGLSAPGHCKCGHEARGIKGPTTSFTAFMLGCFSKNCAVKFKLELLNLNFTAQFLLKYPSMKVLVAALALVATLAVTGNAEPLPEADPGFHRGFGSFGGRSHGGFGGYGGYGGYRGKRSAEAEALADPEADPSAGHLSCGGYGGYGGFQGISRLHHYGKRSDDADPEPGFCRYGGFGGHSGGFEGHTDGFRGFSGYGRYGR